MSSTSVAILVPGIMGSRLGLGDEEIWPGPLSSLIGPFPNMDKLMRRDLVAYDCIRRYGPIKQYQRLLDDLESWGFQEEGIEGTLVVAFYDWRKDNAESANILADAVDHAASAHGPNTDISILGHSQGGLVARYYLESGFFDARPGFRSVRRLIALATPHRGAPAALPIVLGYERQLFLSARQVLRLCSDSHYPAAYQLLPPQGEPFGWDPTAGSWLKPRDIFDQTIAQELNLVPENLGAAQEFRVKLASAQPPAGVRYFSFAGTQQTTADHVMLVPLPPETLEPDPIELDCAGDGTVPTWSGFLAGQQHLFVRGEHAAIYRDRDLRKTLAALLGKSGRLRDEPEQITVVVREQVVVPGDLIHVTVRFGSEIPDFSGCLTSERANIDEGANDFREFDSADQFHRMESKGLHIKTISLTARAPTVPGIYRIGFQCDMRSARVDSDELVVQRPA